MDNCPHCKTSLIGEPIPEQDRHYFGGATNFRREIGMEYLGVYDGVWEWQCPDCEQLWDSEVKKLRRT